MYLHRLVLEYIKFNSGKKLLIYATQNQKTSYLVVVVEGKCSHFAVVGVSVLLREVFQGTVGDVRVTGHSIILATVP